jgi:hypothetical protein
MEMYVFIGYYVSEVLINTPVPSFIKVIERYRMTNKTPKNEELFPLLILPSNDSKMYVASV